MTETIAAPIQITFYDANDEEIETYTRTTVRWGILKKTVQIAKALGERNPEDFSDEEIDAISSLVVAIFGDRFTIQDLDEKADLTQMLAVLQAVMNRATGLVQANPTMPPATAPRGRKSQ